ncbi:autotransporter assembly complex protein TamA [Lysobacter gummosus]|uniref:Translocation and assembly module subunit TamA n=1 Tax=Lysobacter gummosus TaxID=262324 RepID=A0ABY3XC06_9GAMM|nr:autotransporter assembly complex family protein [Lysobacter gummosus]ALN94088.1 surface antigen family protein [Lysobacter gummosus]UNP29515.1 autotransporter assembly complex protein TamA [Lysobacter gummosus]
MPLIPRLFFAFSTLAAGFGAVGPAWGAKVGKVEIRGLDEAMTHNVRVSLSLVDTIDKDVSGRRLGYLLREAENETREALEPFGYYSPTIKIEDSRGTRRIATPAGTDPTAPADPADAATAAATDSPAAGDPATSPVGTVADPAATAAARAASPPITVIITVDKGEPVKVRRSDIAILGAGSDDRYLKQDLAAFRPGPGQVFDHAAYEASKTKISRRLAERGYFDADFSSRRVEITRAEHAAAIDLVWTSGQRYDMGPISFEQTPKRIIRDSLLERLVYWEQGSYYHQRKLDTFRESLARLDYFSSIDIEPQPENAVDGQIPVKVTLTPAKRSIYTSGLSYGTDSGAGVRLGVERRYINDRGHKALAQIDFAQRRKTATLQYRIPAFAWLDGWYTFSLQGADEQTDYIDSRRIELVASRSGKINQRWTATASLHGLRERWAYADEDDNDPTTPVDYRTATFLYPSLRAEFIDADDRLYPRNGISATGLLRGGLEAVGSDANFLQAQVTARWYKGLGERSRLITRGELGHTFTNALVDLPPSLRFYAGGDRSIRGYEWREVGPRIPAIPGRKAFALGAKNVITGSVEFEQYFNESWGAAVFVDSGSAFDDSPDMRTGVGVGVRWRSPVGPLRVDIARGLDHPDSGFQLYLNIGADL